MRSMQLAIAIDIAVSVWQLLRDVNICRKHAHISFPRSYSGRQK